MEKKQPFTAVSPRLLVYLCTFVDNIEIKPSYRSDYSAIKLELSSHSSEKHGPGFWKFNTLLLMDGDYCAYIRGIIAKYRDEYLYTTNHALKWDMIKLEIRSATIAYSKTLAHIKRAYETELYSELERIESLLCVSSSEEVLLEYIRVKNDFELL